MDALAMWDATRNAAQKYAHLPTAYMRFMAVVKEADGGLDAFAKEHEELGVLACCALGDAGLREYARRLVELQARVAAGELTPPQAFLQIVEMQKLLPSGVRDDMVARSRG